jgi:uncharacterized protein (TIGR03084 family)
MVGSMGGVKSTGAHIFDDLVAEQDRLEAILAGLPEDAWLMPSDADGWTIADVVLHLAQTEEAVVATASAGAALAGWRQDSRSIDEAMEAMVRAERTTPAAIFERWRTARRAAVTALRAANPDHPLVWAAASLKPRTLATTRLAEHWAHGLDITVPLKIAFPDTDRLRHIAWLAHTTLPYAFSVAGQEPHDVFCELTGPDGTVWSFGSPAAGSTISGPVGAFCRVGARRLTAEESGLRTTGPHADAALRVLRNYAA